MSAGIIVSPLVRESQDTPRDFTGRRMFDNFECSLDTCDPSDGACQFFYASQAAQQNKLSFHHEVKKLGSIPKTLHVSWARKFDVMKHKSVLIQQGLQSFIAHNPDWVVEISDNRDVDRDLHTYLNSTAWDAVQNKPIVEKIDLWRLLVIYHRGGMYADIDRLFNLDMKSVIGKETKMLLPFAGMEFSEKGLARRVFDFSQDFLASAPGNPAIKVVIDLSVDMHLAYKECKGGAVGGYCNWPTFASDKDFLAYAGAGVYNEAMTTYLFGLHVGHESSECVSKAMVEHIASLSPHVVTYVERLPCNSIVAQDGCAHLDNYTYDEAKSTFFADEGRGHWFDEV
jgi:hypothetical protein